MSESTGTAWKYRPNFWHGGTTACTVYVQWNIEHYFAIQNPKVFLKTFSEVLVLHPGCLIKEYTDAIMSARIMLLL